MILFFYGEDTYRLKQKLKQLREKFISSSLGDTNLVTLDGKIAPYDEMVRQILAMPFLARKRLVIIENLLKAGKKDIQEKVAEFLKKVPDSTVLVFVEEGMPDRRTGLFRRLNRPGQAQEFKLLESEQLRRWVRREVELRGGTIETQALTKLMEAVGSDLWRMTNEIEKLTAYNRQLTAEDVELLVNSKTEANIFDLVEATANRNPQRALRELSRLFNRGAAEIYILTMLVWQYRNLLIIKDLQQRGVKSRWDLAKKGGLAPFVVTKNIEAAAKYSLEDLKNIYEKLLDFDWRIKTGKIEPKVALELLVFQLAR